MRSTIYKCDECKKEIGDKIHLSLSFGAYSGVAVPPKTKKQSWVVAGSLQGSFSHFCSTGCLKKYFDGLLAKIKKANGKNV